LFSGSRRFIVVLAAFTVFVVVPFGPAHAITDMNIGILFMLGVSSLSVLGIVMAGWASNSHYPLIGALRSSAQMVSYEVAMGLAVVSAIMMTSLHGGRTQRHGHRHAEHDWHRAGAAGAGRVVHLQILSRSD
jgi:NADH:ubiquinone oxidoreductase subunit H